MPMPRQLLAALTGAATIAIAGCGDGGDAQPASTEPVGDQARTPAATGPATAPCAPALPNARLPRVDTDAARRTVDAAAARATATGHRFHTDLTIATGALRVRATLDGRRAPTGTSTGSLRWRGPAALVLDDQDIRIVGDELATRVHATTSPWAVQGSAAGVALDVGRELLMHPQLLRPASAAGAGDTVQVAFVAPAAQLRAYATTERRGPVTDLLRATTALTLESTTTRERLVADRFTLATVVPRSVARGPIRTGTRITIRGATTYCAAAPPS